MSFLNTRRCLIDPKPRNTIYWHIDPDNGNIWCYCNACSRGYSLEEYCFKANIELKDFLKGGEFNFEQEKPNEVNKMDWPTSFLPLSDPRAKPCIDYLKDRGIEPDSNLYYDTYRHGVVFPYYFEDIFTGAQIRLIEPKLNKDGELQKIDTMPGTRLGLLFYNWNQAQFVTNVKGVIVTEGAFNALSIQQALYAAYGGLLACPWKVIACSGAGLTDHQIEKLKELKDNGIKIVLAPDSDEAGLKMFKKAIKNDVITHYTFVSEDMKEQVGNADADWNDVATAFGKDLFSKLFIKTIKKVEKSQ